MPAVLAAAPAAKQRADLANGNKAKVEQTPPPKKKVTKNERPSVLCSTPPTCIKDRDCHVEYTRKEFLGEGGFARCYLVTNRQNRQFAAKVVAKASLKTPKAKGKLIGEIKVHQSLQHPNIVRYQECFEDKTNVYIILELCENKSLLEMLRRRRRLTEPEVRFFMLQILGATKYMHEKRVIHRDLKLGNLFLDSRMNIKLGDFGLAALLLDDNERKRTICGTPNYIAPEILCDNGGGHSYEVDLWSIGVILYALLVGKPPFQSKEVKSIYRKIKDNQYEFPTTTPISEEAKDLIAALLCPDPQNRPSIDEISDHKFFHSREMPREIPLTTLEYPPKWDTISKPMSELNWRYVSVQAGLGKNVQVGTEAGKSVQACITSNEHPLKNHVARLREEAGLQAPAENVLPMTLSPRVPAPQVGGIMEGRLMGKGAKRSVKQVPLEDDKENQVPIGTTGSLRKKGNVGRKTTRATVQQAFPDIPEETNEEGTKPQARKLAPPERKPSGELAPAATTTTRSASTTKVPSTISQAALSKDVGKPRELETKPEERKTSGPTRILRGTKDPDPIVRPPSQAEKNVPSRAPSRIQAQRATALKRTAAHDNLKESAQQVEEAPAPRLLRSRPALPSNPPTESKIPVKLPTKAVSETERLAETLRAMGDNLTLALNTPPKRLSSQFHRAPVGLPTFVTRWVDYSGKYGLAYQFCNSISGMYFNDSSSIALSSDCTAFDYLPANGELTSGIIGQHPADLEKKVKLAVRYRGYMADNLHGVELPSSGDTTKKIFLADFRRASNAVLFRMSDNTIQVNFPDHSKVVLWDFARAVRYVDKRSDIHIWSLAEAVTSGSKNEVVDRLKIVAKELFNWADAVVSGKKGRKA